MQEWPWLVTYEPEFSVAAKTYISGTIALLQILVTRSTDVPLYVHKRYVRLARLTFLLLRPMPSFAISMLA